MTHIINNFENQEALATFLNSNYAQLWQGKQMKNVTVEEVTEIQTQTITNEEGEEVEEEYEAITTPEEFEMLNIIQFDESITQAEVDSAIASFDFVGTISTLDEAKRIADIKAKADSVIESAYSPLKQRKLLSIAVALQDIKLEGGTLTTEQQTLMQSTRDVNAWITSVRTIENTAIADGTPFSDIVW